jgi:ABC-2 type transport system ATP-binding protein
VTAVVRTEGLTKGYGETLAFDSLDLTVEEGEVYGYLGPNGAGKTTTIRLLPAESFELTAGLILLGIAAIATLAAIRVFERRDLTGE